MSDDLKAGIVVVLFLYLLGFAIVGWAIGG